MLFLCIFLVKYFNVTSYKCQNIFYLQILDSCHYLILTFQCQRRKGNQSINCHMYLLFVNESLPNFHWLMIMKYSIFLLRKLSHSPSPTVESQNFISKLSVSFQTPSRLKWNHSSVAILVNSTRNTVELPAMKPLMGPFGSSTDKTWSTGEEMSICCSILALKAHMNPV